MSESTQGPSEGVEDLEGPAHGGADGIAGIRDGGAGRQRRWWGPSVVATEGPMEAADGGAEGKWRRRRWS